MARWGPNENERFQFGGVNPVPSATFDDTKKSAVIRRTDQVSVLLQYTKGTETGLMLRLDFATPEDHPENASAFFEETSVDLGTGLVTLFQPLFTTSGFYRLPLPVVIVERILRVSLKSAGGAWSGTGELWFTTGNLRSPIAPITVP